MLGRRGEYAIRALLELALQPGGWRSVADLATAQDLPAPMLEQLLLLLRRAGLVEARRGRRGGYRLLATADEVPLARVLKAVAPPLSGLAETAIAGSAGPAPAGDPVIDAGTAVTRALEGRLQRALERELASITLEDLLFDWRSARASQCEEGGLLLG